MTPRRARRHWLVKTEPEVYSIHDLERDKQTFWDGVRNYQARNTLRDDMADGDPVLIYHSNADPLCVAGLARVVGESYPDPTQFDPDDPHFDPKAKRETPTWMVVDLEHVQTFAVPVTRAALQSDRRLDDMVLLQRGSRLSVQPVTPGQFTAVLALAQAAGKAAEQAGSSAAAPLGSRAPRKRRSG